MKIGILTFHCAHNYGGALQAYALQMVLKKMGHDVYLIDFRPNAITEGYKIRINKELGLKGYVSFLMHYTHNKRKYMLFKNFQKEYMNLTPQRFIDPIELNTAALGFDAYICGSDQVWNMSLNGGLPHYFLSFVNKYGVKKISYAASFGGDSIPDAYKEIVKTELLKFDSISVRESRAVEIVRELCDRDAFQVLDPVLLLDKNEWLKIAVDSKKIQVPYALLYYMEDSDRLYDIAEFISTSLNIKVVCISTSFRKSRGVNINVLYAGPREFLGLIKNSSIVCTNSFHAICFSIIFDRPFITVPHTKLNSRLESVLKLFQLEKNMIREQMITKEMIYDVIDYNYNEVKQILNEEKNKALKYLKKAF